MQAADIRPSYQLGPLAKVVAPFVSAASVLIFGVLAYRGVQNAFDAERLVTHTHQVIEANDAVLARVVDAETGERGYIITGDSAFLDPYRGAEQDAIAHIGDLRRLTADNPAQQARIGTLARLVNRRFTVLDARIRTRREHGFERVQTDFAVNGGGKPVMDSARAVLAGIAAAETGLLGARRTRQRAYETEIAWTVIIGAGTAALLGLLISMMLSRSAAVERRLSRDVRQRADELELANTQLQDQASEMETLNEELQTTNDQLAERTVEAEQANRVKADFLANMSHDLRTPLNAILGYIDLLETGVHGPMGSEQANDLRRIKRSAGHLRALITEVLDFAKIEAGQSQLAIEDVRMDAVVGELRPIVEQQVAAKGLTLETSCRSDPIVRADREKIDQILVNLVANAIKFTDAGGSVAIECCTDGASVRIDVRDTGSGIPADKLDAIFVPFVQLEASGHRGNERGVGLGLAISRQLARAMHGDVTVESVVGRGSTFSLRLPRAAGAISANPMEVSVP
jgi:signal transduction histidine kinase